MNYILSEEELLKLLIAKEQLQALNTGGVDNWAFYSEALWDYYKDEAKELHFCTGEELDYESLAKFRLAKYQTKNNQKRKVVRTYPINYYFGGEYAVVSDLQDSLTEGWKPVMCNPIGDSTGKLQGLEYIMERDV
jgi:hypothetical protein